MKKRIIALLLLCCIVLPILGCSKTSGNSTFSITFIDVGQGDAALVECDEHYMLIDGGDTFAGEKVCEVLKENEVKRLDYLVVSHLHKDHFGGLIDVLKDSGLQKIGRTLSNADYNNTKIFGEFETELRRFGSKITLPQVDKPFNLGSAKIEIVNARAEKENDSLVLLITYGKTTFLFTGDMEQNQESLICGQYNDERQNITLLKVAHHGSDTSTSIRFLSMLMPQYAVISVEENNPDHPSEQTLSRLEQADVAVYQTDEHGDIIVKSNGETVSIETSKQP